MRNGVRGRIPQGRRKVMIVEHQINQTKTSGIQRGHTHTLTITHSQTYKITLTQDKCY